MTRHLTLAWARLRGRSVRPRTGGPARIGRVADDGESGQIMVLTIAYAMLALALVLVLASASAVHIERKQLLALADAAALDAADAIDLDAFYAGVLGAGSGPVGGDTTDDAPAVPLSDESVRTAVTAYLATAPAAGGIAGLAVGEPTGAPDGFTAQVTLTGVARPPLLPWVLAPWSDGISLRVTSSARAG